MSGAIACCATAAGCGVLLVLPGHAADRRLRRLAPGPARGAPGRSNGGDTTTRRFAVALAAVALTVLVGGVAGVVVGAVTAVVLWRALAALEPASVRRRRQLIDNDLPIALDLLSACLSAGTSVQLAVRAVAASLGDPLRAELVPVLTALELGVSPAEAWQALPPTSFGSTGRTLARASTSGAPLADVVAALAEQRRDAAHVTALTAARKAGVAAVGPLGACFLPAFICTSVVPVVAGLATHVLH
jgi:pilus assembly protein TadC